MPVFDAQPWMVKVFLRGSGKAVVYGFENDSNQPIARAEVPLTAQWRRTELKVTPGAKVLQWTLDITHSGPVEMFVDDVSITHPSLAPMAAVPEKPLGKDKHTLLYLPCQTLTEQKLEDDVRFITIDGVRLVGTGRVELSRQGEGRFGRSVGLWPGSSMMASSSDYLKPASGTVEMWVKFRTAPTTAYRSTSSASPVRMACTSASTFTGR